MPAANSTPSGGDDATARTLEDIERRAEEVLEQEQQALRVLAACMREVAVRLPVESRLPLDLAKAARDLESYSGRLFGGKLPAVGVQVAFGNDVTSGLIGVIATYLPMNVPPAEHD